MGKPGRTQTLQEDGDGVGRIFREPVNGLTHAVGALFSAAALVVLVREAVAQGPVGAVVGAGIFGTSLVLLYSASALYHLLPLSERGIAILRRLDHAMIYVLIAGTYSPVLLGALGGPWGWTLFGLVWGLALVGILLKIVLVWNAPLADGPLLRGPGVARNPHAPLPPGGAAGPLAPLDRCGRGFLSGGRRHLRVPLAEPLSRAVRLPRALASLCDGGERQPRLGRLDPDAGVSRCSLTPFR